MSTTVVIGCTPELSYTLPVVPACLLWRELVGYESLVCLVGDVPRALRAALDAFEVTCHITDRVENYSLIAAAKHVRQHVAVMPFGENIWLMPSDADLLPLSRDYYHQHEGNDAKAVLYYSNGDGFKSREETIQKFDAGVRFPTIPMCHTTMRAREWRDAWDLSPNDLRGSMARTFQRYGVGDASKVPEGETSESWAWWVDSDQRVATNVLARQPWFPSEVKFIERAAGKDGYPADRLDRSAMKVGWTGPGSYELKLATAKLDPSRPLPKWVDAHVPKDPEKPENWRSIQAIVDVLVPQHSAAVRAYYESLTGAKCP